MADPDRDEGSPAVPPTQRVAGAISTDATLPAPSPSSPEKKLAPADPGKYVVADELARGGLGRILRARDERLDRTVAIKELLDPGDDATARFAREAFLTARLQHPAIVPVYDAGVWPSGAPFFAMKLVSGRSLEAAIRETLTLRERLALLPHVIDVANALAYAHEQRIIHRDLKPANVLVGAFGETVVVDWGLAKDLGASDGNGEPAAGAPRRSASVSAAETVDGAVMGTPAYMPPEQALGNPVDERADVYAIGSMLYHLLAGEPPYGGTSSQDVLLKVIHDPPEPLAQREPDLPPDLVAIVGKAMARRQEERYPSARELAEDLRRFQTGQLVSAHEYGTMEILARWLRRHRPAVIVAAAMLAGGIAFAVVAVRRVVRERDRARAAQARAERAQDAADQRGDQLALVQAGAELEHDPSKALAWLKRLSPRFARWDDAQAIALEAVQRGFTRRVWRDKRTLAGAALSPDGKLVFLARKTSDGFELSLIDTVTNQARTIRDKGRDEPGDPSVAVFSPDASLVAYAAPDDSLGLWDVRVGAARALRGHGDAITALAFGPDGQLVVSGDAAGGVRLWTPTAPASIGEWKHETRISAVAVDPTGTIIVSASEDGEVRVLRRDGGGAAPRAIAAHAGEVTAVGFADGHLVTAGRDGHVRAWDVDTGARLVDFAGDGAPIVRLAIDQKHARLAAGTATGKLWVWDGDDKAPRALDGHDAAITGMGFGGGQLVTASGDHTLRVWDPHTGASRILRGHTGEVIHLSITSGGGAALSGGLDKAARLWHLGGGDWPAPPDGEALRPWLNAATDEKIEE